MPSVIYEKKGNIAHIVLNRPESLNAVNRALAKELSEIWNDFRDDDRLWVAILSAQGKSFCGGADIKEMQGSSWEMRKTHVFGDDSVSPSLHQVWKPIIGALHRYVYGVGFWLALECDIRIAADNTIFGLPEVKANLPVLFAAFLSFYLPPGVATELMLTGNPLDSQRAYQLGLINKIVSYDELMPTVTSMAEELCKNGPLAVRATKEIYSRTRYRDFTSALALTEQLATPVFRSEDFSEAQKAFKEKRRPEWKLR